MKKMVIASGHSFPFFFPDVYYSSVQCMGNVYLLVHKLLFSFSDLFNSSSIDQAFCFYFGFVSPKWKKNEIFLIHHVLIKPLTAKERKWYVMPEMRAKSLLMIFGAFHVTNWYIFCVLHQKMNHFDFRKYIFLNFNEFFLCIFR